LNSKSARQVSKLFGLASPLLALLLTLIAGAIMFVLLGKDPLIRSTHCCRAAARSLDRSMNWQKRRRR